MCKRVQALLVVASTVVGAPCVVMALEVQLREGPAVQQAETVEQGKFRLHKFEQPIGEETFQITRGHDSLTVRMDFKFNDRGTDVPLLATFRGSSDLTPQAFEIRGKTSRFSTIDEAVEVQPGKVRLRNREHWTEVPSPSAFFTIAAYAPATMQMLLVRYWATHGSPVELATLPGGRVKVEPRGDDTISVDGKREALHRYTIEGLIWGRETLWFNSDRDLIASVTTDAEDDHFEAVRDGYESALGTFVGRAGADGMAALADLSKGMAGSRAATLALVGGTLVDGTGRPALPDAAVVMRAGRIVAAGRRSQIKIPSRPPPRPGR